MQEALQTKLLHSSLFSQCFPSGSMMISNFLLTAVEAMFSPNQPADSRKEQIGEIQVL